MSDPCHFAPGDNTLEKMFEERKELYQAAADKRNMTYDEFKHAYCKQAVELNERYSKKFKKPAERMECERTLSSASSCRRIGHDDTTAHRPHHRPHRADASDRSVMWNDRRSETALAQNAILCG